MNMKKKRKKFFTLTRQSDGGFTLIELIVTVAIIAILGGVGVPAYSGYVEKTNMNADRALVGDVAKALSLGHYSGKILNGGSAVISSNGVTPNGVGIVESLKAAFGEDLSGLKLKYDGWTDDGLLSIVAGYSDDDLAAISNSTFVSVSTPESLMKAVTDMTKLASDVIAASDFSQATQRLNTLGMTDAVATLNKLGLDPTKKEDQQAYSDAVSNLLVSELSKKVQEGDGTDNLSTVLFMYSSALAYSEATGDDSVLNQINTNLSSDAFTFDVLNSMDGSCQKVLLNGVADENGVFKNQAFQKFGAEHEANNIQALNAMMGAINKISSGYTDAKSLTNPELYSSDEVSEQVNNYVDTIKAMAGMDSTDRDALTGVGAGSVAVFVSRDGAVSIVPNAINTMN